MTKQINDGDGAYLIRLDRPDKPAHVRIGKDILCHGFRRGKAGEWCKSETPDGRHICSQCLRFSGDEHDQPSPPAAPTRA